jgi:hypothetical protein
MVLITRSNRGWIAVVAIVAVAAAFLAWQQSRVLALRNELALRQGGLQHGAEVRKENARLHAMWSPAVASDSGREAELDRARAELESLRREVAAAPKSVTPAETGAERFAKGSKIPAGEWKNVGNATPQATLETVLWAAAGGDIDTFAANLMLMNGNTRRAAQALLDSLPADARDRYRTPELLLAALTVPDVPIGGIEIREWGEVDPENSFTSVTALFSGPDGKMKQKNLIFLRVDDRWKLVVTEGVIAKYAKQIKAASTSVGGG